MGDPVEHPAELPSGTCLFHFCEAASFKNGVALFCGEEGREVLLACWAASHFDLASRLTELGPSL